MTGEVSRMLLGPNSARISVPAHGLDHAADAVGSFQHDHRHAPPLQAKRRGQPGDAASDDGHWFHIVLEKRRSFTVGR